MHREYVVKLNTRVQQIRCATVCIIAVGASVRHVCAAALKMLQCS
jgi:hypothetical protein